MEKNMKEAVMVKPKKIEFTQVPVPEMGENQVLVQVKSIGVCGSDIHVYHGLHPYTSYPVVQGHEVSCVVERVGSQVRGFRPGEKVTIEPQVSCGECYACTHGLPNICNDLKVLGFQTPGVAVDYFATTPDKLVKLPEDMTFPEGAMIEPLSVGVRATQKGGKLDGKKILVFGAGPIGNLTAQAAKGLGASKVMIADINDFRLSIAGRCDIDYAVNPSKENTAEQMKKNFGPDGADLIIECVGVSGTMDMAVELSRKGTDIVVVGVFGEKVPIDMGLVQEKELRIIGIARYLIEDFTTAIELVQDGKVKLTPLLTHEFDFYEYQKAYEHIDAHGDSTMKVTIRVNEA
jgi:L-iditol 2-dehydrogenase